MTITHLQTNKSNENWIKTRFTFLVTFVALGVVRKSGSRFILNYVKDINCVNCEPINYFTKIYSSESSVESQFSLYLGIPSIGCTQDILT
jgi:hypothetical protein